MQHHAQDYQQVRSQASVDENGSAQHSDVQCGTADMAQYDISHCRWNMQQLAQQWGMARQWLIMVNHMLLAVVG